MSHKQTYLIGVVDNIEIIRKYKFATRLNCYFKYIILRMIELEEKEEVAEAQKD